MANVIFRGPVSKQYRTISDKLVDGALLPATWVEDNGTDFVQLTTAEGKNPLLLMNRDFYGQDLTTAYEDNSTGEAMVVEPAFQVQSAMAAGTYAKDAPLTIAADGRLAAATSGDVVVASADFAATVTAGELADVVIANSYKLA